MKTYFDGWNFWHMLVLSGLLIWEWYLGRYGKTAKSIVDLVWMGGAILIVSMIILATTWHRRKENDPRPDTPSSAPTDPRPPGH